MGYALVVGSGLIAFGPSMMLWVLVVGRRPSLVIIGIVSAFFWLASFALASVLWTIVPAAQNVWMLAMITGVGLQGFGRLALAKVYMKTEKVINDAHAASEADDSSGRNGQVGESEVRSGGGGGGGIGGGGATSPGRRHDPSSLKLNRVSSSIAAGVGWGAIHAVIIVGTALSKNTGPGAAFSQSCPRVPSVIVSAFSAQAFVVLDLLLMAVAFAAVRSGDAVLLSCSFGLHYIAALSTGFNFIEGGCAVSLPLLYGVVILSAVSLGRFGPLKSTMTCLGR